MTTFTEQMQERARNVVDKDPLTTMPLELLNTIISDTITATLKEVERAMEGERRDYWHLRWEGINDPDEAQKRRDFNEEVTGYINSHTDTIKARIQDLGKISK